MLGQLVFFSFLCPQLLSLKDTISHILLDWARPSPNVLKQLFCWLRELELQGIPRRPVMNPVSHPWAMALLPSTAKPSSIFCPAQFSFAGELINRPKPMPLCSKTYVDLALRSRLVTSLICRPVHVAGRLAGVLS